jgi:hypothetical protein
MPTFRNGLITLEISMYKFSTTSNDTGSVTWADIFTKKIIEELEARLESFWEITYVLTE